MVEKIQSGDPIYEKDQISVLFNQVDTIASAHKQISESLSKKLKKYSKFQSISESFPNLAGDLKKSYEIFSNNYSNAIILIRFIPFLVPFYFYFYFFLEF